MPRELREVDFRVRRQRENPHILWVNDLGEARKAAAQLTPSMPANVVPHANQHPALNRQVPLEKALQVDVTRLFNWVFSLLVARVATTERNVAAIYQSRTWRLFVTIGEALQNFGKALGRRPN